MRYLLNADDDDDKCTIFVDNNKKYFQHTNKISEGDVLNMQLSTSHIMPNQSKNVGYSKSKQYEIRKRRILCIRR